jgi:plasmid segregation protein ParM
MDSVRPIPAPCAPSSGTARRPDAVVVAVDGRPWAAAIEPARLEGWQRSLHADYAATPAYRALVQAALVLADRPS